jgi:hypothetical protein
MQFTAQGGRAKETDELLRLLVAAANVQTQSKVCKLVHVRDRWLMDCSCLTGTCICTHCGLQLLQATATAAVMTGSKATGTCNCNNMLTP